MKTPHQYDITLLDGELLILPYQLYDSPVNVSHYNSNAKSSAESQAISITDRMHRRERELPYLFLQWID
jgi:hypothetical protein